MPSSSLALLDWTVLLAYGTLMVGIGVRFRRRQTDSKHYFLAGGGISAWTVGMSMFATVISSWAFLALPAKAFASDLQSLIRPEQGQTPSFRRPSSPAQGQTLFSVAKWGQSPAQRAFSAI